MSRLETEQRSSLSTARESARSLLGIIDDILDVSKIEAGRLELRPELASIAAALEGVFLVYSVAASRKNLPLMRNGRSADQPRPASWIPCGCARSSTTSPATR